MIHILSPAFILPARDDLWLCPPSELRQKPLDPFCSQALSFRAGVPEQQACRSKQLWDMLPETQLHLLPAFCFNVLLSAFKCASDLPDPLLV